MALNNFLEIMRPAVEEYLHTVVDQAFQTGCEELHQMLAYHMGWEGEGAGVEAQGKRVRPILVLLTSACCSKDWQTALPAAAAIELVHNFSLIHDDIQDQSPLRRGRPTLWKKWGTAQAINAGDAMFSLAQIAVLRLIATTSLEITQHAAQLLSQTCLRLTEGQYLDISYETLTHLPMDGYWPMVKRKTAALLAACCEVGALVAGAPIEQQSHFRAFGENLGLAFQVLDDFLGIWGEAALTGKSTESDLVTGKKSLPVLYGLEKKGSFAARWQQGMISGNEVAEIAKILEREGAKDYTLQTADHITQLALQELNLAVTLPNEAGQALIELTHQLLVRQA
jgi:geranylgeranyl diphosphate synthase, type I